MWGPPRPGIEATSPALAGGFFTTTLPGKPQAAFFFSPKWLQMGQELEDLFNMQISSHDFPASRTDKTRTGSLHTTLPPHSTYCTSLHLESFFLTSISGNIYWGFITLLKHHLAQKLTPWVGQTSLLQHRFSAAQNTCHSCAGTKLVRFSQCLFHHQMWTLWDWRFCLLLPIILSSAWYTITLLRGTW